LSYHRTREPRPVGGSSLMTVCTNDLALADLVEDPPPRAIADPFGGRSPETPVLVERSALGAGAVE
jgi:hypothetical protein